MIGVFQDENCEYIADTRDEAMFYITSNKLDSTHWAEEVIECLECGKLSPISSSTEGICFKCILKQMLGGL